MIARSGLLLLLVLFLRLVGSSANASAEIPTVEIQIRPSQTVRLAPADADAFRRRLSAPPPYAGPLPAGETFVVTSDYWDATLGTGAGAPAIDAAGTYFWSDGIVKLRQAGRDAFFVLDQRQRAMLGRYIRLAGTGSLPSSAPGAFQVLTAAARAELISIELAGEPLPNDAARLLWRSFDEQDVAVTFLQPLAPPSGKEGYWITFTTVEGRALQYFYEPASGRLTDFLGSEAYTVRNILPGSVGEPRQIEQQEPHGSLLWWPAMLGGGLSLLAAAVWLNRRMA
ncbi:MAG TPA: hypothetical protein VIB47_06270 [Dehalococcoidia bacterium]